MTKITKFTVDDVRFPTSKDLTGSDAIHTDPDYSATYVTVYTSDNNLKGFGIAFTIGKGNDIVAECIKHFFPLFTGKTMDEIEGFQGKTRSIINKGLESDPKQRQFEAVDLEKKWSVL